MMKLKWVSVLCAAVFSLSSAAADRESYQDWWWNPAQSGMGVNVAQQGDHLVASWYHFQQGGRGVYLMLSGALRSNALIADLVRASGPVPGAGYDPSQVTRETVGTGTLRFLSNGQAELTYRFDNQSGSLTLERYVYALPEIVGPVAGIVEQAQLNSTMCGEIADVPVYEFEGTVSRVHEGYKLDKPASSIQLETFRFPSTAMSAAKCTVSLSFGLPGQIQNGVGTIDCERSAYPENIKETTPVKVERVAAQGGRGLAIEYTVLELLFGGQCQRRGKILLMSSTPREAVR